MILCINMVFVFHWSVGLVGVNHLSHTQKYFHCDWLQLGCESFLLHWSGRTTLDTQSWSLIRKKEGTIYIHFPNTSNNKRYSISTALLWCLDVDPEQKKTVKTPKSQGCFDFNDTPQNASILSEFTLTIFTPGAILSKISSSVQTISVPKKKHAGISNLAVVHN